MLFYLPLIAAPFPASILWFSTKPGNRGRLSYARDKFAMLLLNTKSIGIPDHPSSIVAALPRMDIDDYAVEYFL